MVTENPTCEHSSRDEKPVSNLLCESNPGARGAWGVHQSKYQECRCNSSGGGGLRGKRAIKEKSENFMAISTAV